MLLLGYDLGSSFVKASLLNGDTGQRVASASFPEKEMLIQAPEPGWAEQSPQSWWECARAVTRRLLETAAVPPEAIRAIGLSYQMHGLVLLDRDGVPLRPSILWCDSRAVDIGRRAFEALGEQRCLRHLLSSPGNFTASKARWVLLNQPELFERLHKMMLPGDYLAYRMTGQMRTTLSGLSEGMLWDFPRGEPAEFLLNHYEIAPGFLAERTPTFGEQGRLTSAAASELGLAEGTLVSYRAGDQPNNALSLCVLEPGEIAATAGTSGVVYGVSDQLRSDAESRVNSFAHVNHSEALTRLGILLCINGTGSANRWVRDVTGSSGYDEANARAATIPIGSDGLRFFPFGNGAERMLRDRDPGAELIGLRFNRHSQAHFERAVQEGIVFAFRFGMDILKDLGVLPVVIRAGLGNLFQSPVFREALATLSDVSLELYDTDGAEGAARGAGIGCGHFRSHAEAFETFVRHSLVEPDGTKRQEYTDAYESWAAELEERLR